LNNAAGSIQTATRPRWPELLRGLGRLLAAALDVYALGALAYLIVRLLVGERLWAVALLNNLMPIPLLPAAPALIILLLLWRTRAIRLWHAALVAPAALAFALLYGGLLLPRAQTAPADAPQFSLLTFNVQSQMGNAGVIADLLLLSDADVLALQEFTQTLADQLAPRLAETYPHQALHPSDSFAVGMGVFSRFPILEESMLELAFYNQRVQIALNDTQVFTLFNVHPPPPSLRGGFDASGRSRDITAILDWAAGEGSAVVLAGDWNATDQSHDYGRIAARYRDSFREAGGGLGATWPNFAHTRYPFSRLIAGFMPPLIRIDHIFHSQHVTALEAAPLASSAGSDHFPVRARLAVP
jgi:endonuclease/exonuclease/phosphatase (EEP) superfamily protein YafD